MKPTPEQIMDNWKEAYRMANDKEPPRIEYYNGWYQANFSISHLRGNKIIEMTENLRKRVREDAQVQR